MLLESAVVRFSYAIVKEGARGMLVSIVAKKLVMKIINFSSLLHRAYLNILIGNSFAIAKQIEEQSTWLPQLVWQFEAFMAIASPLTHPTKCSSKNAVTTCGLSTTYL